MVVRQISTQKYNLCSKGRKKAKTLRIKLMVIFLLKLGEGKVEFKVARYSFSGSIPPKFEHKLRRHKQSFGKITTTVVLDKDENLL